MVLSGFLQGIKVDARQICLGMVFYSWGTTTKNACPWILSAESGDIWNRSSAKVIYKQTDIMEVQVALDTLFQNTNLKPVEIWQYQQEMNTTTVSTS